MCFAIIAVIFVSKRDIPTEESNYEIILVRKESEEIKTELEGIIEIKKFQDVKVYKNLNIKEINYNTGDKINTDDVIATFTTLVNKNGKNGKTYKGEKIRRYVSSFDGYILKMNLVLGEGIPETAFTFVSPEDIEIYTQEIPVDDENIIILGKKVTIKFSDNEEVQAEVTSLEKMPGSNSVRGILTVLDIKTVIRNIDKKFKLQVLNENKKEKISIPLKAIVKKEQSDGTYENYIYKIDHDNKVLEKIVILGETNSGLIEVKEGLKDGDRVIINPDNKIKNGEIIKNIN